MALKIITDSASDIPPLFAKEHHLEVIPTPVVINDKDYFDGETIMPAEFYKLLASDNDIKTYHVSQFMFQEHFEPYAKRDDQLIYICFSTGIAGTFQAANLAKDALLEDYPNFDLTIIDGRCASIGFGLLVYYAVLMLEAGCDKDKIVEAVEFHRDHMEHVFTVETLEYLFKGGRLSRTSAIAGGLLDIKPIIKVNKEGALEAFDKVRGRNRSLKKIIDYVGEKGVDLENQVIGLVHGDCYDTLLEVKQTLTEKYGCAHFIENYVGCAIGAHTGPGIIGVTFLNTESPYKQYFSN